MCQRRRQLRGHNDPMLRAVAIRLTNMAPLSSASLRNPILLGEMGGPSHWGWGYVRQLGGSAGVKDQDSLF